MSGVVSLANYKKSTEQWDAALEATLTNLEAAVARLRTDLVNLAMVGPWREWNDAQPAGATAQIHTGKLLEVGDLRVKRLAQLLDYAEDTLVAFRGEAKDE